MRRELEVTGGVRRITIPVRSLEDYLSVYNGIFNMTPMELSVLAELIRKQKRDGTPFGNKNREEIAVKLGVKSIATYLTRLLHKSALKKEGSGYTINPILIPGKHRHIMFDLEVNIE